MNYDRKALLGLAVLLGALAGVMLLAGIWASDLTLMQKLFCTGGLYALLGIVTAWLGQV